MSDLDLKIDGAALQVGAALSILDDLEYAIAPLPPGKAGLRLHDVPELGQVLSESAVSSFAVEILGIAARPVRAILFDKSPSVNWALGWHQDRTITVRERAEVAGFGLWSRKSGVLHVEPPFAIIEKMMTIRLHLDDVPIDNAPLVIARGSHCLGRVEVDRIEEAVAGCKVHACLARRGDVWTYATPILHASAASHGHARRRVLQVDYSADTLPGRLAWQGV